MTTLSIFPENADARTIFSLRKTNPSDAYSLAVELIKKRPDDLWIKRGYAWTLYDQAKLCIKNRNFEKAVFFITEIEKLNLPDGEEDILIREKLNQLNEKIILSDQTPLNQMIDSEKEKLEKLLSRINSEINKEYHEKIGWEIHRYLKVINENRIIDVLFINKIMKIYKYLIIDKPSKLHSAVFYQVTRLLKHDVKGLDLISIIDTWNPPDDLTTDDFKESLSEGKRVMPNAEKFIYTYVKMLLQNGDTGRIKKYLNSIDNIISTHPKYSWLPYQKCKLLLAASSDKNEILKNIIPVVKKKTAEFWTWSSLGEVLTDEPEKALSCYCKALTCRGAEGFLLKVRQNLAKLLIAKKLYHEAKYEIEQIIEIKNKEKQKIPSEVNIWMKEEWFKNTTAISNNNSFYSKNQKIAEEIVFGEAVKNYIGVITNIDKVSGKAYFSISKNISGGFKPKKQQILKTGDILDFKLNEKNEDGMTVYEVLSTEKTNKLPDKEIYREFEGSLRISKGGEIGFIDSVYVSKSMIESASLKNNNLVKGIAIFSLNKKRNEFGWKAIKVWKG